MEDISKQEFKDITIDELAMMMNRSFIHLEKKIDDTRKDVLELQEQFKQLQREMSDGFDRIENILIEEDRKRISRLEDKMLQVQVVLDKK